jgi:hypothetical protein
LEHEGETHIVVAVVVAREKMRRKTKKKGGFVRRLIDTPAFVVETH